jgi:hypothetical protein
MSLPDRCLRPFGVSTAMHWSLLSSTRFMEALWRRRASLPAARSTWETTRRAQAECCMRIVCSHRVTRDIQDNLARTPVRHFDFSVDTAFRVRFASQRKSITLPCSRSTHPKSATSGRWNGSTRQNLSEIEVDSDTTVPLLVKGSVACRVPHAIRRGSLSGARLRLYRLLGRQTRSVMSSRSKRRSTTAIR